MPPTPDHMPSRIDLDGRSWWRFLDGTLLPVIAGGDGTDGGGSGGDDGAGDGGTDDGGEEPPDLGEAGKKALADERKARRDADKAHKAAEKRAKDAEARLAKLEADAKPEAERALEKARRDAADAARKEATSAANARIVRAEIKAAAGGKLADPADAVRLLDLDDFEVDDDGEVDTKAIAKAIDDLLKDKPYLGIDPKKRPAGSADGGARGNGTQGEEIAPGSARLRHAYANSSTTKK